MIVVHVESVHGTVSLIGSMARVSTKAAAPSITVDVERVPDWFADMDDGKVTLIIDDREHVLQVTWVASIQPYGDGHRVVFNGLSLTEGPSGDG